jgi:hypothetical protein
VFPWSLFNFWALFGNPYLHSFGHSCCETSTQRELHSVLETIHTAKLDRELYATQVEEHSTQQQAGHALEVSVQRPSA